MRPVLCKQHHTFSDNAGQGQVCWELVPDGPQAQVLLLIDQRIRWREAADPGERPRATRRSGIGVVAVLLGVKPRVVRRMARRRVLVWVGRELRERVYERVLDAVCPYRLAAAEAELVELMAGDARRETRRAAKRRRLDLEEE